MVRGSLAGRLSRRGVQGDAVERLGDRVVELACQALTLLQRRLSACQFGKLDIFVQGGFELEDLPLGGKTFVNGKQITRSRLRNGDRVQIGSTIFTFQEKARDPLVH